MRYEGTVPLRLNPFQLAGLGLAIKRLDRMARTVPLDAPWEAARAERWNRRSLGQWIERTPRAASDASCWWR